MSRNPLGKIVTVGFKVEIGTGGKAETFFAQAGNGTCFVRFGAKDSPPPKLFDEIGVPEGCGVSSATIAVSLRRYSLATLFTSSGETFLMASISSLGELRPSTAIASDHKNASPEMEFLSNSASAIS